MPSPADAAAVWDSVARLMDIDAVVIRAPTRPQRQYSASANGPKYSAVIGKTKFITPHRLTSALEGDVVGNNGRTTETDC